jgi:hypothetical protein
MITTYIFFIFVFFFQVHLFKFLHEFLAIVGINIGLFEKFIAFILKMERVVLFFFKFIMCERFMGFLGHRKLWLIQLKSEPPVLIVKKLKVHSGLNKVLSRFDFHLAFELFVISLESKPSR